MLESLFNKVEYCKILKNTYFEKHSRMAASAVFRVLPNICEGVSNDNFLKKV